MRGPAVKRYEKPQSGKWIQPVRWKYRMACCDCGLVHNMDSRVRNGRVQFRISRNGQATYAMRKHYGITVR